jgi:hypothetical protein
MCRVARESFERGFILRVHKTLDSGVAVGREGGGSVPPVLNV